MAESTLEAELDPDVLKEYIEGESGLSFRSNNRSWIFSCPRCGKENKLWIRKHDGHFICWSCAEISGYRGKRPDFALAEMIGISVQEVRSRLYGSIVPTADQLLSSQFTGFYNPRELEEEDDFGPEPISWPYNYYPIDHQKAGRGRAYLESRGIPLDIAMQYGIRFSPEHRRVMFPVEQEGLLYGYQGRLVVPNTGIGPDGLDYEIPKILSSDDLPREYMVMFADRLTGSDHAVLTEGPIDAIKAHECGGNIAAMGKAVTGGQLDVLRKAKVKKLYLGLDPDASEEIMRLVRDTSSEMEVYAMMANGEGEKPDLGAMSFAGVRELFLSAPRVSSRRLFFYFRPLS